MLYTLNLYSAVYQLYLNTMKIVQLTLLKPPFLNITGPTSFIEYLLVSHGLRVQSNTLEECHIASFPYIQLSLHS